MPSRSSSRRRALRAAAGATAAALCATLLAACGSGGDSGPDAPALVPVAKAAFRADFYGGQDIYAVYSDAARSIRPNRQWGLPQSGSVQGALDAAQQATLAELKNHGLKTRQ
ncbi:hypothetical protein J5Y04_14510 [Kitasatospora sp. RG8]|uniref:hypothetical protein n=1 Tax=Kitasatospora sp. RG8 TaxID=2820815 RepID=UPI001ADEE1C9|nr:hypothetical protein [Kitasatospora sp. RG8]MBP0450747.1 hypothetical protein [Kitasatospora sp. RG8]